MKKNYLWTLAAALALVGCSDNELLETQQIQEQNAIAFDTYVGDNAQTRATVIDNTVLGVKGFGVNAYYTKTATYQEVLDGTATAEDFMQNTKVTLNPDKGENGLWEYSPAKYWPNNAGDKVSFFAYGPYAKSGNANGMVVDGTSINFTVADEVKNQVDLIYNTNYDETIDATKQAVNERIHFQFAHALSRISFTVEAAVDEVTNGSNLLDGNTRINVKKVALIGGTDEYSEEDLTGPFYKEGTLSLLKPENEDDSPWSFTEEQTNAGTQGFVLNAKDHFYHTVKDMDAENPNGEEIDVMQLTRFNASEPQRLLNDSSYLMVIPQEETEFKIYIEYDVISGGNDNDGTGTYDESAIVNKITSADALTVTFEQGKAYNFNLILGMTSVKFEASVADWEDENPDNYENEEWLPENSDEENGENEENPENIVEISGLRYSVTKSLFYIDDAEDLSTMASLVNSSMSEDHTSFNDYAYLDPVDNTYKSFAKATYVQTATIDFTDVPAFDYETVDGVEGSINFTKIGDKGSIPSYFMGTYDGQGHEIKGLYFKENGTTTVMYIALFEVVQNASISNLTVSGEFTSSSMTAGIVASDEGNSTIKGCVSNVNITADYRGAAGIVATANSTQIIGCTNNGAIIGNTCDWVGGIVGVAKGATTITACANTGNIQGENNIGGLLGIDDATASIYASYNTATVNATAAGDGSSVKPVGGLVGQLKGTITGCYNIGAVQINGAVYDQDTYTAVGAIVGVEYNDSLEASDAVKACYWGGNCVSDNGLGITGWTVSEDVMNAMNIALDDANCNYNFSATADNTLLVPEQKG